MSRPRGPSTATRVLLDPYRRLVSRDELWQHRWRRCPQGVGQNCWVSWWNTWNDVPLDEDFVGGILGIFGVWSPNKIRNTKKRKKCKTTLVKVPEYPIFTAIKLECPLPMGFYNKRMLEKGCLGCDSPKASDWKYDAFRISFWMVSFRGFDTWIDLATASRVAWLVGRGKDWLRNRQNLIVKRRFTRKKWLEI